MYNSGMPAHEINEPYEKPKNTHVIDFISTKNVVITGRKLSLMRRRKHHRPNRCYASTSASCRQSSIKNSCFRFGRLTVFFKRQEGKNFMRAEMMYYLVLQFA
jgi:hypothetical protein